MSEVSENCGSFFAEPKQRPAREKKRGKPRSKAIDGPSDAAPPSQRRPKRRGPPFLEAYPRLWAEEMSEELSESYATCEWDSDGDRICVASLTVERSDTILISHEALGLPYLDEGQKTCAIAYTFRKVGNRSNALLICPGCGAAVRYVILSGADWRCRKCHRLRYASQDPRSGSQVLRRARRASELRDATAKGKPHQVHSKTYRRQREEQQELQRKYCGGKLADALTAKEALGLREVGGPFWGYVSTTRPQPRSYLEAYPALTSDIAKEAVSVGRPLCLWREPSGAIIGCAEVTWISANKAAVRYAVQRSLYGENACGNLDLEIVFKGSAENNKRALFVCQHCRAARTSIILKAQTWACRDCHLLLYRSSLIPAAARRGEKYERLKAELEKLVREKAPQTKIDKVSELLAEALRAAGPPPHPLASQKYLYQLKAEWVTGGFAEDGFYDHPDASRGGEPPEAKHGEKDQPVRNVEAQTSTTLTHNDDEEALAYLKDDLVGDFLFSGDDVQNFLRRMFHSIYEHHVRRVDLGLSDYCETGLHYILHEATKIEPLVLSDGPVDVWMRPDDLPRYGGIPAPESATHQLATVFFGCKGSHELLQCFPSRNRAKMLRGRFAHGRLQLTARVHRDESGRVPIVIERAMALLRDIVAEINTAVGRYNDELSLAVQSMLDKRRAVKEDISAAEHSLRQLKF